jgi:hypothetical protein
MTEDEIRLLRGPQPNIVSFFRAEIGGEVIRLFAGFGNFPVPAGGLETEGGVYDRIGRWGGNLPDIDWLMNGQAQAIDLQLSGLDLEEARSFLYERDLVIGAPAGLGWAVLDERLKLAGPIHWSRRGYLSQPRLSRQRTAPNVWTRSLTVTLISGPIRRRKPFHTYLTGPDQRRRSPTDAFCDRTPLLNIRSTRPWPN